MYPIEEPGIGPNKYNFDDDVLYQIHVATGSDVTAGARPTAIGSASHQIQEPKTILQSYLGVIKTSVMPRRT